MSERIFSVEKIISQIEDKSKAVKTVFHENAQSNAVVWYVPKGQEIPAHYHPTTDDIWVVVEGTGEYYLGNGETHSLEPGLVAVAAQEQIHGVRGTSEKPLIVVAISAPLPVEMVKV